jgi:hypothetical protein
MVQNQTPTAVYWLDNTLYLNITKQCPNNCYFCFKHYKQGVGGFNLKLNTQPSVQEITAQLDAALHFRNWGRLFSADSVKQPVGLTFYWRWHSMLSSILAERR